MRKHIFNAGPCKLPDMTLENTAKAVNELGNCGQSILKYLTVLLIFRQFMMRLLLCLKKF